MPKTARRIFFLRKRLPIHKSENAAILNSWIAVFLRSTYFEDFRHKTETDNSIAYKNALLCNEVRFLSLWGFLFRAGQARCRSPPPDFDFDYPLKQIGIGGNTHERNQSAGLLPVLYIGYGR